MLLICHVPDCTRSLASFAGKFDFDVEVFSPRYRFRGMVVVIS